MPDCPRAMGLDPRIPPTRKDVDTSYDLLIIRAYKHHEEKLSQATALLRNDLAAAKRWRDEQIGEVSDGE